MASRLALVLGLVLGLASQATALAIYTYTGNPYDTIEDPDPPAGSYTTAMSISGSFTVAAPLPASFDGAINDLILSYSFSDGRNTFTESNSTISLFNGFNVITGAAGEILRWRISLEQGSFAVPGDERHSLITQFELVAQDAGVIAQCVAAPCLDIFVVVRDRGISEDNPGVWTLVPEPSTGALVALGVTGLAARRRSRAA